jgi:hypothetical protein
VAQPLGVVHILVSDKATKYRLPEQAGQCVPTILATACVGNNPARGHHLPEDVGSKFPLGCSEAARTEILSHVCCWAVPLKAIPTQLPTKAKTIEFRFIGMRALPEVTGPRLPISKNIEHNKCCIFVTLLICNNVLSLESELVLARKLVDDRLAVGLRGDRLVARLNGDVGGPRASSRAPRCSQRNEAIDLMVMFRGRDLARANSGK